MLIMRSLVIFMLFGILVLIQPVEVCDTIYFNIGADHWIGDDDSTCGSDGGYDPLNHCMDDNDNCPNYSLEQALNNLTSNVLINITTDVMLFSIITLVDLANITITGHNNPTVKCNDSGGLRFTSCSSVNINGIVWQHCGWKSDKIPKNAVLEFTNSSTISILNCSFQHSIGQIFVLSDVSGDVYINNCSFAFNTEYEGHGSIIHHSSNDTVSAIILMLSIVNCCFKGNEGAGSLIYISPSTDQHYVFLENSTFVDNQNVLFHLSNVTFHMRGIIIFQGFTEMFICINSEIIFDGSSSTLFSYSNNATTNKIPYVFLLDFSKVYFKKNANAIFGQKETYFHETGGSIYSQRSSCIIFEDNCFVRFIGNEHNATIIHLNHSSVTFKGNSIVLFEYNRVGFGVINLLNHSSVTFRDNCTVTFFANVGSFDGGSMYLQDQSNVLFRENSAVTFESNIAFNNGGTIYLKSNSNISFRENSIVTFVRNYVNDGDGGVLYLHSHAYILFEENSEVLFDNNAVCNDGAAAAAICLHNHSYSTFNGHSTVKFHSNKANLNGNGGVIHLQDHSSISFNENCEVVFTNNSADHYGTGGVIHLQDQCNVSFNDNCKVSFANNAAYHGGAIYSQDDCNISFNGNCGVTFNRNAVTLSHVIDYFDKRSNGGAIYLQDHCNVAFKDNSTVTFNKNMANYNGGAIYFEGYTNVTFTENSRVIFNSNTAYNGGALYSNKKSIVVIRGRSAVMFYNNRALLNGGACACLSTDVALTENTTASFINNSATEYGGALFLYDMSNVTFDNALVNFSYNIANFGAAILAEIPAQNTTILNTNKVGLLVLNKNRARTYGNSVFLSTNESSLHKQLLGTSKSILQQRGLATQFATIPYKVVLHHPEMFCSKFNNDKNCTSYQVNNVMLGQVITISGCVYDYFDNPVTITTHFQVSSAMFYEDHDVNALSTIHLTCRSVERYEISITGNESFSNSSAITYSIMLTSTPLLSHWRPISLSLSIQLSPCHLGFQYSHDSQECECYNENTIVVCSGSISTIKRGYWFGTVNEKLTVAICPIGYCDFSCCETNNGYHQLSQERENQCSSHRTGVACGNCEEGYTLSYSADCVSVDKCTVGWTVLVVTLTLLYWITIVVAIFTMMYYKVPIGYLYAITYYYSMIDVQHLYSFSSLNTAVVITSSVFKISPEFLGQFCLVKGLSGIDIQFIHYIHPSAICVILIMISLLAKCSRRLSTFISRGIIHVICCLLLLSYTSVASTSLLLFRSLSLHNVDKVFTYLSPDIEYLHGRHLAYFIVAVLCTIIIVIGLPLLLLLEPFLNHKMNFTRIKPLLDQFQGCYKDRYRWFAAYYMICRLVLVMIIIYPSDYFTSLYLRNIANVLMVLVLIVIRPYHKESLNTFDGLILLLMMVVAQLSLFRSINSSIVVVLAFILIILPSLSLFLVALITHKEFIRKLIVTHCRVDNSDAATTDDNNELPMKEFDITIDESMRTNATVCDISQLENNKVEVESQQDVTLDRESFLEDDKHIN